MLITLSPAKNLDYERPTPSKKTSKAAMLGQSDILMAQLKRLSPEGVSALMGLSDKLGVLNYERFQDWQRPFTAKNARQAIFAFNGDVYAGLDAYSYTEDDLSFAQAHLRILSGLYGVLRPLDLIQPYRLEMGTKLANESGQDLYHFWAETITENLNKALKKQQSNVLVNLASNEYFKSVKTKSLNADVVTPSFKDLKNGRYKIISFYAKKARGLMSAYIIKNKITHFEDLKQFDWGGYRFNGELSTHSGWVFTRDDAQ